MIVGILAAFNGGQSFPLACRVFEEAGHEIVTCESFDPEHPQRPLPEDEISKLLASCDAVFLAGSRHPVDARTLPGPLSRLRGIVTASLGFNAIDVDACSERGILVANSPVETNYDGVFQHTVLLILASVRQLPLAQQAARMGGGWAMAGQGGADGQTPHVRSPLNDDWTLGVIGLGRIGYRVARLVESSFGMKVLAYDPYVSEERAREIGVTLVDDLHEVLRHSDIVSIHCFLSSETRHLIGERELRAMKQTAYIINTARGPIIDGDALVQALQEGWIAGAGLDVTEFEPLPIDSPLLAMENVIVTPHVGAASLAHKVRASEYAAANVLLVLDGQLPRGVINATAIPPWAARFGLSGIRHGGLVYTRIP